jgi:hypothetical protein
LAGHGETNRVIEWIATRFTPRSSFIIVFGLYGETNRVDYHPIHTAVFYYFGRFMVTLACSALLHLVGASGSFHRGTL